MTGADVDELRLFAKKVHQAVDGRECPVFVDADDLGFPTDFVDNAITYWLGEGVMKRMGLGTAEVCLTRKGVVTIRLWPD